MRASALLLLAAVACGTWVPAGQPVPELPEEGNQLDAVRTAEVVAGVAGAIAMLVFFSEIVDWADDVASGGQMLTIPARPGRVTATRTDRHGWARAPRSPFSRDW